MQRGFQARSSGFLAASKAFTSSIQACQDWIFQKRKDRESEWEISTIYNIQSYKEKKDSILQRKKKIPNILDGKWLMKN